MIYYGSNKVFNTNDNSLMTIINTEDEDGIKKEEGKSSMALKIAKYLISSGLGDIIDIMNVIFSFLFTIVHCIDTYSWS